MAMSWPAGRLICMHESSTGHVHPVKTGEGEMDGYIERKLSPMLFKNFGEILSYCASTV